MSLTDGQPQALLTLAQKRAEDVLNEARRPGRMGGRGAARRRNAEHQSQPGGY